jgi:hypothetical protein
MTIEEYNAKFAAAPPKRKRQKVAGSEDQLQRSVARLLDLSGLLWLHIPNGGQRNAIVAAKLKAQGVKRGAPDIMIFEPEHITATAKRDAFGARYSGLAIELKVAGKPTPAQFAWHDRLRSHGWRVEVCYTLEEVLKVVKECYPNCLIQ